MQRLVYYLYGALFFTLPANSVIAASTEGRIGATIMEQLTIKDKKPLQFGVVKSGKGTVTVTPDNRRLTSGSVKIDHTSLFERAKVTVQGTPDTAYIISTPRTLTFTREKGKHTEKGNDRLMVTDFQSYSTNAESTGRKGKLNHKGKDIIYVGGTLIVPENVAPGSYSGEVLLTVSY